MKKIGQGLQFNVYEKGNKVVKIPTSKLQIKSKLLLWTPSFVLKPSKLEEEARKTIKERNEVLREIQNRKFKKSLLGNLAFRETEIEQDRLTELGLYLKNYEKAKKRIDEYILFIFDCWRNGFSERTYNLTINNGVNSKGEITLIDFGELSFKKSDVERAIRIKRWRKSWSFKRDLSENIRDYYDKKMCEHLTSSNLDKYWRDI